MRRVSIDQGDIQDLAGALRREEEQPRHVFRDVIVVTAILALACLVAGHATGHSPHMEGPRRSLVVDIRDYARGLVGAPEDDADQEGSHSEPDEEANVDILQHHFATGASSLYEEPPAQLPLPGAADGFDKAAETSFRSGDPCEIVSEHSAMSVPCTFLAVNSDGTSRVQHMLHKQVIPSINSEFIHRYTPIRDGSDAICTMRKEGGRAFITACKISRGFQNLKRSFFYEVEFIEYIGDEMQVSTAELPFDSVERIIEDKGGIRGVALEKGKTYFLPHQP